jgi:hypothetical protein
VRDVADEQATVGGRQRRPHLGEGGVDGALDVLAEIVLVHLAVDEALAELADGLLLGEPLDLGERVDLPLDDRLGLLGRRLRLAEAAGEAPVAGAHQRSLRTTVSSEAAISMRHLAARDLGASSTTGWPWFTDTGISLPDGIR